MASSMAAKSSRSNKQLNNEEINGGEKHQRQRSEKYSREMAINSSAGSAGNKAS